MDGTGEGGRLGIVDEHVVSNVPTVSRHETVEGARNLLVRERFESVDEVVVLDEGRLVGVVPAHRLLAALLRTHDQDLARLGGYLASTRRARQAAQDPAFGAGPVATIVQDLLSIVVYLLIATAVVG